jgi:murein DD-endopeptidase MepM/ murein hydrolase activator NlpD
MIPAVGTVSTSSADKTDPKVVAAKVQAMFMELMIKSMEDSVGAEDGMFGSSSSSEIYRGMFREQLGAALGSKVGGTLVEELEKSMNKSREKVLSPAPPAAGLPVAGIVTSEVGWRKDPFSGAMAFHKGMDIAAPQGTSIRAVASGTVVESGTKGEYGNAVVIQTDDGHRMLYGHNAANFVHVGERVQQGETIASVGATGKATGPHVHFEVTE